MDSDSWTTSTRRRFHQNSLSRSDVYDEFDGGEEELRPEFMCPFCAEDYDVVGLCCHIDEEHPVEVKNGIVMRFPFHRKGIKEVNRLTHPLIRNDCPQAAGVIHSDFEKGFIRAETVAYDDFVVAGSFTAAREKGLRV